MKFALPWLPLLLVACVRPGVVVQAPGAGAYVVPTDASAKLPIDERVAWGKLPNGLTWYVEPNQRPEDRMELRLVVRAGSILEDEDQLGVAHFVEHMAFNGTEHFPGNDLVGYLESVGMRFGADLNAYTGFDETVYVLQLPTDDPDTLESGFLVMRDWATGVLFDPEECAKERGVVKEEWRMGEGLQQRIRDATLPLLFHGSRYLERLPIGTEESLDTFSCDAAKRFYRTWYRPDLMAVMAVGDFDPKVVERHVKQWFGPLKVPEGAPVRPYYRVPDHDEVLVSVFQDDELPQAVLTIYDKVDDVQGDDHASYREFLLEQMVFLMLNERLGIATQSLDVPYLGAAASAQGLGHERGAQALMLAPKEGQELEALRAVLLEVERVRRFGFTPGELARARDEMARNLQAYFDERDKTDSKTHIEELLRVYLTDEPMPGIPYEYVMSKVYLPDISLDEANARARGAFFDGRSRVVQGLFPGRGGGVAPTETEILAVLADIPNAELTPPVEEVDDRPLMAELPPPGKAERVAVDADLGTSTWKLSNGATVILKPTTFQEDEVLFEASSPGGAAMVSDDDYIAAITATSISRRSGLGDLDIVALAKKLAGKTVEVTPSLGRTREWITGRSSVRDLETMFQLLHLSVVAPRFTQEGFLLERQGREASLRNRLSSPDAAVEDAWVELMWKGNPRQTNWSLEDLAEMDLARSEAIYADRFGDVGDFTFVFVGNLDEATFVPLLERYVASLPGTDRDDTPPDDGAERVDGVHFLDVSRGSTERALIRIEFHGPFDNTWEQRKVLRATSAILETRLLEELREELGGTYGVGAYESSWSDPEGGYSVRIEFECDPGRADELLAATWEMVDQTRDLVTPLAAIRTLQEKARRKRETDEKRNDFWVGGIAGALARGEDPRDLLGFDERNDALSAEAIQEMARRILDETRYVQMVARPE